ncbi:hypothetical protein HELRODRAFT_125123, partial [Helobdella robusta]|uniref:PLAT domain-containing protein n=1 Tax=Helobdella robusta TaxID=6412 RepID=T1EH44_HELRO
VGSDTTALKTQCMCNHLTSFGGNFFVAPNTINFATVFTLDNFLGSLPVFSTIIVIFIIYILILVWARHMDKADVARWGSIPLEDNLPTETYYYQMTVYTGMRKNAGTASKPSFILSGDEADTGVRHLTDGKRKEISTGSINNYVLSVEKCLGPLTFLRIWHDNSGKGSKKGWFLDQIEFTDVQTGERFFFVCAQWMAVEEGDGQIERVVPVAGKDDMTQF